jgi:two-component system, LytTR family, sensor kinase
MKTKYKVLVHFIFWFYIINQSLVNSLFARAADYKLPVYFYQEIFWSSFLNILSFYTLYFCLPFLFKFRYKIFSVLGILLIFALTTCYRVPIDYFFWKYIIVLPEKDLVMQSAWVWNEFRMVFITGIYSILIHFMISWFDSQKLKAELINQTKTSELALLRSQLNPHFLFNTLNNIYSLVYNKSDNAPEAVMKLSSIMRYTLYDSNTDKVKLEKEIEYLKSFIELQQLRFKAENFVKFDIIGNIERHTIAPMVFISFVENAFKHGNKKVQSPGIIITLTVNNERIIFEVMNYMVSDEKTNKDIFGGIGLQNIQRRLELLYKEKHKLTINQPENQFIVKLEIDNQ